MKTLKAVKYIAVFVAVVILLLIVSYNYTYVTLMPDYDNVIFIKKRFGSFSLDVPDLFADTPLYFFNTKINFPNYRIFLVENIASDKQKIGSEEVRCYSMDDEKYNFEDDIELSQMAKYRAVLLSPKSEKQEFGKLIYAFGLKNHGCVSIFISVKEGDMEAQKIAFKNHVLKFFKYYKFKTDDDIDEGGFRTNLGLIAHNNEFNIETDISLRIREVLNPNRRYYFSVNFTNEERESPDYFHYWDVSVHG
ncbi:MAG: hypothetical protein LBQ79_11625 [Deltaproteobacteria bacterium]|jgi:hypothetical protein|nr:hypothetical protein [Deltaproteobacteria bacterium]